jgi:signal transduction histidine kinase
MSKLALALIALAASAMADPAGAQQAPPTSAQARRIEAMVKKAAALVDKEGKAAFAAFRKPNSEWRFGHTYLFAYDTKLNVLLNAAFPNREGENMHGKTDANGKPMHDEFLKVAQTQGSGWVDYMFPKPGQTQPSQKWSYVKKITIDGTPGIIGAGFYPN